jgi:hypothetical protein
LTLPSGYNNGIGGINNVNNNSLLGGGNGGTLSTNNLDFLSGGNNNNINHRYDDYLIRELAFDLGVD